MLNRILRKLKNIRINIEKTKIYGKFSDFTMIPENIFIANLELAMKSENVPGAIVECGTWKGGMIAGMACLLGDKRDYVLFDSFSGLPDVQDIDGPAAVAWQSNTESKTYHNNCTARIEDAQSAMSIAGVAEPRIYPGWFNDTLPTVQFNSGIAILRLDSDWYESESLVYQHLFDLVNVEGLIIVDDYHVWDGCSRALHDYLSKNSRIEKIRSHKGVCYLIKTSQDSNPH